MNPSTKHDRPGGAKLSTPAPASVQPGQQPGPPLQPSVELSEECNLHTGQQRPSAQTQSSADLASSLTSDMKESASTASRAIKEQASQFASDVGHELGKTAEEQKARGVGAIQCFARAMTSAAAELENQSPQVAEHVRDAAQKVVGLSEKIAQRDVNELVRAATELARSQPLLFVGGAVATGFAVSRFLMSSAKALPDPPHTTAHT